MLRRGIWGLVLCAAASPLLAQPAGWESFGPPLFQVSDVATGADETTVYASAANTTAGQSGIFQSTDAGNTWTGLVQAPTGESYGDLLVDPGNPQTLYTGTLGADQKTRLYRTVDGGVTWFSAQTITPLCVPSFSPGVASGTVVVACGTGLWKTTDSGQSWQSLPAPFTQATRLARGAGGLLYAYGPTTLFRSNDGGSTWQAIGQPLPCAFMNALAADPTQPDALVAGAGLPGGSGLACGGVFRSADGGTTWTPTSVSNVLVTDVLVNPIDATRVYASAGSFGNLPEGGVFASLDGGATWTDTALPGNPSSASRVALSPHGRILYAATQVGVYQLGVMSGTPTCTPNDATLCLDGGRYRVQAGWTKPDNTSGSGHAIGLTSDTGYFWFFSSSNVEVIVKVLEGCTINSHRWVFASGLTNVFVSLTVEDILTGALKAYTNTQGTAFVPIQDTSAFTCSP